MMFVVLGMHVTRSLLLLALIFLGAWIVWRAVG